MSPEDIKKLLGGYATGTLTAEEQQALFAAALEDQELFDALAREQPLHDLLRDPAARAELLCALDTPSSRLGGFWQWLRDPVVAGLATAGVAAIAIVAVWQGTRVAPVKTVAPQIVAELRSQAVPVPPPAEVPPPVNQTEIVRNRTKVAGAPPPARLVDEKAPPAAAPPPPLPEPPPGMQAMTVRKAEADVNAPATTPAPPVPAAAPALMARKAEGESLAAGQSAGVMADAVKENVTLDARAIFYANQLAPGANAFVQPGGGGGARAPARAEKSQADAAPRAAKTVSGFAAPTMATVPRLGVRVSILRGASEVDLTTVLDPGEMVRLKLIPNADGFLYVTEGARTVASGAAERLKPFETPALRFEGSGQKQLYVMLSRSPRTVLPQSLDGLARGNLVETSVDQDRATYVVSGAREAAAQQVVVPVTLTYR